MEGEADWEKSAHYEARVLITMQAIDRMNNRRQRRRKNQQIHTTTKRGERVGEFFFLPSPELIIIAEVKAIAITHPLSNKNK